MRQSDAQRRRKSYGEVGAPALLALSGCFQRTPYPECWVYSPDCVYESADEGGSGDGTASTPTSEPFPVGSTGTESGGDEAGTSSGEAGASSGEGSSGSTGPEVQAPPMILGMTLCPGPGTPGSLSLIHISEPTRPY